MVGGWPGPAANGVANLDSLVQRMHQSRVIFVRDSSDRGV